MDEKRKEEIFDILITEAVGNRYCALADWLNARKLLRDAIKKQGIEFIMSAIVENIDHTRIKRLLRDDVSLEEFFASSHILGIEVSQMIEFRPIKESEFMELIRPHLEAAVKKDVTA